LGRIQEVLCLQQNVKKGRVGWARRERLSPSSLESRVIGKSKTSPLSNTDDTDRNKIRDHPRKSAAEV